MAATHTFNETSWESAITLAGWKPIVWLPPGLSVRRT